MAYGLGRNIVLINLHSSFLIKGIWSDYTICFVCNYLRHEHCFEERASEKWWCNPTIGPLVRRCGVRMRERVRTHRLPPRNCTHSVAESSWWRGYHCGRDCGSFRESVCGKSWRAAGCDWYSNRPLRIQVFSYSSTLWKCTRKMKESCKM